MLTKETAKSLAVSYEAFLDAMKDDRKSGLRVWGLQLLEAQRETGIVLLSEDAIRPQIERAE